MVGPQFLNDLCSILLRFSTHTYGISTDIEKAFLHVNLDEADGDFTRFLWLSDHRNPQREFHMYRFKVVLFGSVSSPFMLNAALHCHLNKNPISTSEDMHDNLYVDNIISGCNSEDDAVHYYKTAGIIMNKAKFKLRCWASNSPKLMNVAAMDDVKEQNDMVKVLGLQ